MVSGIVDPDTYIVKRGYKSSHPQLLETILGTKKCSIHMTLDSETKLKDVSTENQVKACLKEDQILNLAKIGLALEAFYGNPRDIEWAIYEVKNSL